MKNVKEQAISMRKKGKTWKEIKNKLDISHGKLYKILIEAGLIEKRKGKITDKEMDRILRLDDLGLTLQEIANKTNRHINTICQKLIELRGYRQGPVDFSMPEDKGIIGYIAGFLDADGCIYHHPSSGWQVYLCNSNKSVIDWFKSIMGGSTRPMNGKNREAHWKQMYRWEIYSKEHTREFLKAVLPFLKVKKDRAKKALG